MNQPTEINIVREGNEEYECYYYEDRKGETPVNSLEKQVSAYGYYENNGDEVPVWNDYLFEKPQKGVREQCDLTQDSNSKSMNTLVYTHSLLEMDLSLVSHPSPTAIIIQNFWKIQTEQEIWQKRYEEKFATYLQDDGDCGNDGEGYCRVKYYY